MSSMLWSYIEKIYCDKKYNHFIERVNEIIFE